MQTRWIAVPMLLAGLSAVAATVPQLPPGFAAAPAPSGRIRVCAGRYLPFRTVGDVRLPPGLVFRAPAMSQAISR